MLSPRQTAQLGLGAACLILISSIMVLIAGASDAHKPLSQPVFSAPQMSDSGAETHALPVGVAPSFGNH